MKICLVDRRGFEPRTLECKSSAFPITPSAHVFIYILLISLYSVCKGEFRCPGTVKTIWLFGADGETRTHTPFGDGF